jgi:hypothetical protein
VFRLDRRCARRSINSESYMIRFTPRKPKSIWSLVNVRHVKRLQKARKMAEPGIKAFALRAKHRNRIYSFEPKRPGPSEKFKKLFPLTLPIQLLILRRKLLPKLLISHPRLPSIHRHITRSATHRAASASQDTVHPSGTASPTARPDRMYAQTIFRFPA